MAQRAAASDVIFKFGLLTFRANLYPTKVSNGSASTQFHYACETCADATPVEQGYYCIGAVTHGPFKAGDLTRRYKDVDGGGRIEATKDEIAATKSSGDTGDKEIALEVCPADEVDAATLAGGNIYRVSVSSKKPAKSDVESLALLTELVETAATDSTGAKAFVGEIIITKGIPQLARLGTFRGAMTLEVLVRPSEIAEFSPTNVALDPALLTQGMTLVNAMSTTFDPEAHADKVKDRVEKLIAAKAVGAIGVPQPAAAAPTNTVDLGSALEQMLANVNANKDAA